MHLLPSRVRLLLVPALIISMADAAAKAAATVTSRGCHGILVTPSHSPLPHRHGRICCAVEAPLTGGRRRHPRVTDFCFSAGRRAAALAAGTPASAATASTAVASRRPSEVLLPPTPATTQRRSFAVTASTTAEMASAAGRPTPTEDAAVSRLLERPMPAAVWAAGEALPLPSAASAAGTWAPAGGSRQAALFSEAPIAHYTEKSATSTPPSGGAVTASVVHKARAASVPPAAASPSPVPAAASVAGAAGMLTAPLTGRLAAQAAEAPPWAPTARAAYGAVAQGVGLAAVMENVGGAAGAGVGATPSSATVLFSKNAALPRVVASTNIGVVAQAADCGATAAAPRRRRAAATVPAAAAAAQLRRSAAAAPTALCRREAALFVATWSAHAPAGRAETVAPRARALQPVAAAAAVKAAGGRSGGVSLRAPLQMATVPSSAAFAVSTQLHFNPLAKRNGGTGQLPEGMGVQGRRSTSEAAATAGERPAAVWLEDHWNEPASVFAGKRVLTGLQPTGHLHLGNWFSTLEPLSLLAKAGAETCVLIGDIHATFNGSRRRGRALLGRPRQQQHPCTTVLGWQDQRTQPAAEAALQQAASTFDESLEEVSLDVVAWALAAGLQPAGAQPLAQTQQPTAQRRRKTTIALQSLLPEHAVLAALLMGSTPLVGLNRCKAASANISRLEKLQQSEASKQQQRLQGQPTARLEASALFEGGAGAGAVEVEREEFPDSQRRASVGMRFYPLLMAADILGQDADYVLVGDDQQQHIEFTRQVARRWNLCFSGQTTVLASADFATFPATAGAPPVATPAFAASCAAPAPAAATASSHAAAVAVLSAAGSPASTAACPDVDVPPAALAAATSRAAASAAAAPCASLVASAAADLPPELLKPPTRLGARRVCGRLGDLGDPSVKMSKSSSRPFENSSSSINKCGGWTRLKAKGCIFLSDPPDIIAAKIAAAKTDNEQGISYRASEMDASMALQRGNTGAHSDVSPAAERRARPECNNLVHLWCSITGGAPAAAAARFQHASWKAFKDELTACVIDYLLPLQRNYEEVRGDTAVLKAILFEGSRVAQARAAKTVQRVKDSMQFLSP